MARADKLSFEATPILAANTLYLSTPTNIVIALDPVKGTQRWRYDPHIPRNVRYTEVTSRGVTSWFDPEAEVSAPCAHRIFVATLDARLIAVDGRNGQPCKDFGSAGTVDLANDTRTHTRGEYVFTSPPAIYRDMVIVGSVSGDKVVRGFDAHTGALRWSWLSPPQPSPANGGGSGVAASSIFSVDAGRGLVFVPTGSASERSDNPFANSLVALYADTGEVVWHRQLVHHDLWNYDVPAQPLLADLERDGKSISAVVQATKSGQLYLFDRETGEPVFDIIERPVPTSDVPGETASPTQPFPVTPPLVSHAAVTPQDAWGLTFIDRGKCRELISSYRSEGIFTPPSVKGSIVSPGANGGVNWGSLAFDSERQLVVTAVNHVPTVATLTRREPLLSPLGLPCTAPPWGTLAAVDLRRNTIHWQVALGSTRDTTPWYFPRRTLGMPNRGGPMITASGLVFVGAATDNYLRAFDVGTGRELWRGRLPAGGQATPMSYEAGGRQFVVIAAGGHGELGTTRGDHVVAFALAVALP